ELNATTHMLRYNIVQSEIVPSGSPGEARMRVTLTQDHIVQGKPIELKAPWEAAESTKINADEFENAVGQRNMHIKFGNQRFDLDGGEEKIDRMHRSRRRGSQSVEGLLRITEKLRMRANYCATAASSRLACELLRTAIIDLLTSRAGGAHGRATMNNILCDDEDWTRNTARRLPFTDVRRAILSLCKEFGLRELSMAYEGDETLESSNGDCGPSDATVLIITKVLARHLINRLAQKLLLSSVVP
ncbi:hypothetical protein FOZ63_033170, partial [Perkinsus olseni]